VPASGRGLADGRRSGGHLLRKAVPYVLPCALVLLAVTVGWLFRIDDDVPLRSRLPIIVWTLVSGLAAGAVLVLFALTRYQTIARICSTVYPGDRRVLSGGGGLVTLLSGPFDHAFLPDTANIRGWAVNRSEGSSFVLTGVFLLLPAGWLACRSWRRERRIDGVLAALGSVLVLFLVVDFVPRTTWLAQLTGLVLVPHARMTIGIGLASMLTVAAVLREQARQRAPMTGLVLALAGLLAFGLTALTGLHLHAVAPGALPSRSLLALAAAVFAGTCVLVLVRPALGAVSGAVLCLYLAAGVNPLYEGVYDVRTTKLGEVIRAVDRDSPGNWVNVGTIYTTGVLAEAGVRHLSGVYGYPDRTLWRWFDPQDRYRSAWNRYAYVLFRVRPGLLPTVSSPQQDVVNVALEPCSPAAHTHVQHVLAEAEIASPCLRLRAGMRAGLKQYYIYDVT